VSNVKSLNATWMPTNNFLVGDVVFMQDTGYRVKTDTGLLPAIASASCLLTPSVGDRVVLFADGDSWYISSILVSANNQQTLALQGDVTVSAKSVAFKTEQDFSVTSSKLNITSNVANFKFGILNQLALKMSFIAEKLEMTAQQMRRSAHHEVTLFHQQHERVTETKNTQAGRWIQRIHKQWISRSERTTITAEKEVKLDGKRIDLG